MLQSDNSDKMLEGNGGATEDQQQDEPGGRHSEAIRLGNLSTSKAPPSQICPGVLTWEGGHLPGLDPRLWSLPHRLLLLGDNLSQHLL